MPRILYLHGFASSPHGRKVEKLRALLEPEIELVAPDLNAPSFARLDFGTVVDRALEAGRAARTDVLVGSSLGALVALEAANRGIAAPLVLIAPAFGIADRWASWVPEGDPIEVYNWALDRKAPIHRAFFEQMSRVEVDRDPPRAPVVVIMGRRDESVPFDGVASTWSRWEGSGFLAPGSRFVEIAGGDHALIEFADIIANEIRAALHDGKRNA